MPTNTDTKTLELLKLLRSDVILQSIEWINDGRDIELTVSIPPPQSPLYRLRFHWVTRLRMTIDNAQCGGLLMTFDNEYARFQDGWFVNYNFASAGEISFNCNDIFARPVDSMN